MIVSRTPYRVSFFGGGTDYPDWFNNHGGAVLATSIKQYCYIAVRQRKTHEDQTYKLAYSDLEQTENISEIQHPVIREAIKLLDIREPLEITVSADIRAGVGIGSSSTFTVGLLHALHVLNSKKPTRKQLAEEAIHIERDLLNEKGGFQDQIIASYGGLKHIKFSAKGHFEVENVNLSDQELEKFKNSILLVDVGGVRSSSLISKSYGFEEASRSLHFHSTNQICSKAAKMFDSHFNIEEFAESLREAWAHKCRFSDEIMNSDVETVFDKAFEAGALAGKLLGAGSAGIFMFVIPPDRQIDFIARSGFKRLIEFNIDQKGSEAFDLRI